jgi:hypothetical protein
MDVETSKKLLMRDTEQFKNYARLLESYPNLKSPMLIEDQLPFVRVPEDDNTSKDINGFVMPIYKNVEHELEQLYQQRNLVLPELLRRKNNILYGKDTTVSEHDKLLLQRLNKKAQSLDQKIATLKLYNEFSIKSQQQNEDRTSQEIDDVSKRLKGARTVEEKNTTIKQLHQLYGKMREEENYNPLNGIYIHRLPFERTILKKSEDVGKLGEKEAKRDVQKPTEEKPKRKYVRKTTKEQNNEQAPDKPKRKYTKRAKRDDKEMKGGNNELKVFLKRVFLDARKKI